jgi:hypothetical protein
MGLSTPFSGAPTNTITSRIAKSVYVPPEPSPTFQQTVLHILPIDMRTNQPAQLPHGNERRIFLQYLLNIKKMIRYLMREGPNR